MSLARPDVPGKGFPFPGTSGRARLSIAAYSSEHDPRHDPRDLLARTAVAFWGGDDMDSPGLIALGGDTFGVLVALFLPLNIYPLLHLTCKTSTSEAIYYTAGFRLALELRLFLP